MQQFRTMTTLGGRSRCIRRLQSLRRPQLRVYSWLSQGSGVRTVWSQNLDKVFIKIPVSEETKGRDVSAIIKQRYVSVSLHGTPLIEGPLEHADGIVHEDSFWELERQEDGSKVLMITLQKRGAAKDYMGYEPWPRLFDSEQAATTVTHKVFMDIQVGRKVFGKVVFGLYGNTAPKTVENFRALCTGERGVGKRGVPLTYKGSSILKIMPTFLIHGGDIERNNGTGGDSIYGGPFPDENFLLLHNAAGKLAMANFGINSNLSQFHILLGPVPFLDGKHVVFGEVIHGMELVRLLEKVPTVEVDMPEVPVVVADCGELTDAEYQALVEEAAAKRQQAPTAAAAAPRVVPLTKVDIGGSEWS